MGEEALGDGVQVLRIALVVSLRAWSLGVIVEPQSAKLVSNGNYGLARHLDDLSNLVVVVVLLLHLLKRTVRSKAFSKPLEIEVHGISVDKARRLDLKQLHVADDVSALQVVVVRTKVNVLDTCLKAVENGQLCKAILILVETHLWNRGARTSDSEQLFVGVHLGISDLVKP